VSVRVWSRGFSVVLHGRLFRIVRAHGNWLAIAHKRNGEMSSAEYFPYGAGALDRAKAWCLARAQKRKRGEAR